MDTHIEAVSCTGLKLSSNAKPGDIVDGTWAIFEVLWVTERCLGARLLENRLDPGELIGGEFDIDLIDLYESCAKIVPSPHILDYKDALNELVGLLRSNAKGIRSMGGILPGDWRSTVNATNRLRKKIENGHLTDTAEVRGKIVRLFDNSTLLQSTAYAKIRSRF